MIQAGMNVARLNFSHGDYAEHRATVETVRGVASELGVYVGILQDLQGPKIRTGLVPNAPLQLTADSEFTITTLPFSGSSNAVSTPFQDLPRDVKPGDRILLADGAVELVVLDTTPTAVRCRVVRGGFIGSNTGINLPGVTIRAPSLTDKDIEDLKFGLSLGVDWVALSFVRAASDVQHAKDLIAGLGYRTPVVAKLEKREAIAQLAAIVEVSDGIMVARGDLGVELSPEAVPILQKEIIADANRHAIPVITATQMLESMIHNDRPTRAEASDVANAIFDGTDAVMLSAESAIGLHPVEATETMARIAAEADRHFAEFGRFVAPEVKPLVFAEVIAEATSTAARRLDASAIVARTRSGFTARLMSKYRPTAPIVAITEDIVVARQLALLWGVWPQLVPGVGGLDDIVGRLDAGTLGQEYAKPGSTIALTASASGTAHAGETNVLRLHRVSER
jgi:pyruvate kinase